MNDLLNEELLDWMANGETGLSSMTVAFAAMGVVKRAFGGVRGIDYPRDPDDFLRCVKSPEGVEEANET